MNELIPELFKDFKLEALYVPSDVAAYFTITDLYLEGRHYKVIPKEVLQEYLEGQGLEKWLK